MKPTKLIRLLNIENIFSLKNYIYAKVENSNPTGSIKDRTVFGMLNEYNKEKDLKKSTIIEATSGNTGISLSYFSSIFKYKAIIVMPNSASKERREIIKKYGAELYLVEGGMKECQIKVKELLNKIPNSFEFNQFGCPYNYKTHYLTTGPEINSQLENIDYIFIGFGSGGTISGIGKYFKEKNNNTKIIGIEPLQSPLLTKGISNTHKIQGIGANFIPSNLKLEFIDKIVDVDDEQSINMAKTIRKEEKLDIGISSGAALLGAISYIKENNIKGKNIIIIFPDKGDRYSW